MNQRLLTIAVFNSAMLANAYVFAMTPSVPTVVGATEPVATSVEFADKDLNERNCIRQTGSHIVFKHGRLCNGQIGSAYTGADIDRTAAFTIADALQSLDSAVQIRR
jgi:hypothetical protein